MGLLSQPTTCHYFVRLLAEKGKLLRHYTQVSSNMIVLEVVVPCMHCNNFFAFIA